MAEKEATNVEQKENLKAQKGRKVKYGERMTVKIIKETKHYKKGQVIRPHTVMAENLVKQKIAEKV